MVMNQHVASVVTCHCRQIRFKQLRLGSMW